MAIQFLTGTHKEYRSKIIDAINGVAEFKIDGINNTSCNFYTDGEDPIFFIRGWGYLTGSSALNLQEKEAFEIQNAFINHVLKTLHP